MCPKKSTLTLMTCQAAAQKRAWMNEGEEEKKSSRLMS